MKAINVFFVLTALGAPVAQAAEDHAAHRTVATAEASMSEGEVRKVDKAAGKITIKHGPLENLGMPAMTMIFRVKDAAMLEQIKPGDRIRFLAEKIDGVFTVTKLQVVQP